MPFLSVIQQCQSMKGTMIYCTANNIFAMCRVCACPFVLLVIVSNSGRLESGDWVTDTLWVLALTHPLTDSNVGQLVSLLIAHLALSPSLCCRNTSEQYSSSSPSDPLLGPVSQPTNLSCWSLFIRWHLKMCGYDEFQLWKCRKLVGWGPAYDADPQINIQGSNPEPY